MSDKNPLTLNLRHEAVVPSLQPATPLWQRAPGRDAEGRPLSDFMMIVRGLRQQPEAVRTEKLQRIQYILQAYHPNVVFADMNLKINVLWVTIKPIPGLILEIATAINFHLPEAKLVGDNPNER